MFLTAVMVAEIIVFYFFFIVFFFFKLFLKIIGQSTCISENPSLSPPRRFWE